MASKEILSTATNGHILPVELHSATLPEQGNGTPTTINEQSIPTCRTTPQPRKKRSARPATHLSSSSSAKSRSSSKKTASAPATAKSQTGAKKAKKSPAHAQAHSGKISTKNRTLSAAERARLDAEADMEAEDGPNKRPRVPQYKALTDSVLSRIPYKGRSADGGEVIRLEWFSAVGLGPEEMLDRQRGIFSSTNSFTE